MWMVVLRSIVEMLLHYLQVPSEENQWLDIINGFQTKWNFPNCIGTVDGKHIVIRAPHKTGSDYFNYKQSFSIILLALVDHNYCFTYMDIGAKGRASDGGVWRNCSLNEAMEANILNIPPNAVIVADDAFPLTTSLLKPYSKRKLSRAERIFNYRLSRVRRISENAFGILASKFRIFERKLP
nr:protein ALP1-like [Onthophagus taurus]